jgi:isopentenyl phosphate kinase
VSKSDLNASRKQNIESKRKGKSTEKYMQKMAQKSAGLVKVAQTHVLAQPLHNRVKSDYLKLQDTERLKERKNSNFVPCAVMQMQ